MPPVRPVIQQTFFTTTLSVKTTATPLNTVLDLNAMVQSFILCNPSFNSNSVFYGDSNVTASSAGPVIGTGIELIVGTSQVFVIRQERQFYELQDPELLTAEKLLCMPLTPNMIPVIAWKPSDIYLIASVTTSISVMIFRNVYV